MKLSIPAFERDRHLIPVRYTALGENISPALEWSGVPPGTQEFALICEDPDAPVPKPFVHWIVYGLSANTTRIPDGMLPRETLELPILARQGRNSLQKIGYTGPNPPFFHGPHRYLFRLFALKTPLPLRPGAGRVEFLEELEGKILAEASFLARFEKSPLYKVRAAAVWVGAIGLIAAAFSWKRSRQLSRAESSV